MELTIGIGTTFDYSIPLEPMLNMIARAGFHAITIGAGDIPHSGYDSIEGRDRIRSLAAASDLVVNSVHAPFGPECDVSTPDERTSGPPPQAEADEGGRHAGLPLRRRPSIARLQAIERVKVAVDAASALGSKVVIVHLTDRFEASETRERIGAVRESLSELLPYARERGVRLAAENLPSLLGMQVFEVALEEFPELGVCYDSSHALLSGSSFGVLQRFRERVVELHISDNRGKLDDHVLPFEGVFEWEEFTHHLSYLPLVHVMMLEVEVRESEFKDTEEFLRQAALRARRLAGTREESQGLKVSKPKEAECRVQSQV